MCADLYHKGEEVSPMLLKKKGGGKKPAGGKK